MADIYVSNRAELLTALNNARGGETIVLRNGEYGALDLSGKTYASNVTIKAASPLAADFDEISLTNCKNLTFSGIHVDSPSNSAGALFEVAGCSNITLQNSEVNGKVDNVYPITGPMHGIFITDGSSGVKVLNTSVHDVLNGITSFGVTNLNLTGNTIDRVGADAFKFSRVDTATIENNTGPKYIYPDSSTHSDFMQFQGPASSNLVIRGNVFLLQNDANTQGIFLAGEGGHTNVLIEQNIIYTEMANGIAVEGGKNVRIYNNTLINSLNDREGVTTINASGADIRNNIVSQKNGEVAGSNLEIQHLDARGDYHYSDVFQNFSATGGITLEDLKPVAGSLAEKMGAYSRLTQLLNGTTAPAPAPAPDPTPAPTPDPAPAPDPNDSGSTTSLADLVFARFGDLEMNGKTGVVQVAPAKALQLGSATISMTFNADTVAGTRGLVSKDADGYAGGGNHFTSYIKDGTLYVRFQDGKADKVFTVKGIQANTDYELQASFGNGGVSVWLNEKLVGAAAFGTSWATNTEYLQIGANGWKSGTGQAGYTDVFDGTISDFVIVRGLKTPDQIDAIVAAGTAAKTGSTTAAAPAPAPAPVASDEPAPVYELAGDREFAGREADIVTVAHDARFATDEGTVAFSFEADTVAGRQGLVSKDAGGYAGGGNHFSVWLYNGALHVRFQDEDSDAKFVVKGIQANREYDVQTTFDDDSVALWLDGKKIGEKAFTMDWTGNREYLHVGGLGWSSKSGEDDPEHAFDGTISDLKIYAEAFSPQDYDVFA